MKNLSLLSLFLLFSVNGISAQEGSLKFRHHIGPDIPVAVLASIDAGNPGLNVSPFVVKGPASVVKEEKKFKPSPVLDKEFQVFYKGKNYRKKEAYNKEGILLYAREELKNRALPRAVYDHMGKEYNGWELKSNAIIRIKAKNNNGPVHLTYYKLLLQKENKKKRILLDEHGNVYNGRRF